jgi:hypothetical protein
MKLFFEREMELKIVLLPNFHGLEKYKVRGDKALSLLDPGIKDEW